MQLDLFRSGDCIDCATPLLRARFGANSREHVDRVVVWDKAQGICGICGHPVPLEGMELDHIVLPAS